MNKAVVLLGTCVTIIAMMAGCSSGECSEQSCADYGGDANQSFTGCYSSGSGSIDDEFWLVDSVGEEFFRCMRPADDNDGCGVELIGAKEDYCSR